MIALSQHDFNKFQEFACNGQNASVQQKRGKTKLTSRQYVAGMFLPSIIIVLFLHSYMLAFICVVAKEALALGGVNRILYYSGWK